MIIGCVALYLLLGYAACVFIVVEDRELKPSEAELLLAVLFFWPIVLSLMLVVAMLRDWRNAFVGSVNRVARWIKNKPHVKAKDKDAA